MRLTVEGSAKFAHEINRAYCEGLGDKSQLPWEEAPEWQRQSAKLGVLAQRENPDMTPKALHESWLKEKLAQGWVWGAVKDPVRKTHPCCVPYEQLPDMQKVKDYLFKAVCLLTSHIPADMIVKRDSVEEAIGV